ncbi:MAG: CPBP family intramembrane metalloprotease [Calditrichaeota bacterium]|nr:MAG: CPBP family intramembrane metalloprotease [Calditrichota bacterium]MBL1205795.1 CPBP family intramembrane metalloprotease [Calditrichota bacterium]NOG45623.1 CPBP family intramembrane metalloprotease [Calditrichota bacterium]
MEFIQNIFWNNNERRIRSGFRIFLLFVTMSFISIPLRNIFPRPQNPADSTLEHIIIRAISGLILTVLSIWIISRFVDKRNMSNIGLQLNRNWWVEFSFGLVLGIILIASIFLIEYSMGWITISQNSFSMETLNFPVTGVLIYLFLFISVGINEELLIRGYLLTNLSEGLNFKFTGATGAILISWFFTSLLFGAGHLSNPNATLVAGINIAAAGIFLGAGFVLTGRLALPIGVHITWNFFQGNIFGFPVSGMSSVGNSKAIIIVQKGPELWTGGAFGPEAGLIGVCAIATGTLLTILWVKIFKGNTAIYSEIAQPPILENPKKEIQEAN